MAFCSNCGSKLPEEGKFCPNCGASTAPAAPAAPTPVVQAAPVAPVAQPAPVVQAKPVKVKGKINWTVFIIMMLIGALIIGAGVAVVVDILDDGEFNLFGLLDSDSDKDDDDDDDDKKDKDDKDKDKDDEDKDDEDDDDKDKDDKDKDDEDDDGENETTPPTVQPTQEFKAYRFDGGTIGLPGGYTEIQEGAYEDSDSSIVLMFNDLDEMCDNIGIETTHSANTFALGLLDYYGEQKMDAEMWTTADNNYVVVIDSGDSIWSFYCQPIGDELFIAQLAYIGDWDDYMDTWFDIVDSIDLD